MGCLSKYQGINSLEETIADLPVGTISKGNDPKLTIRIIRKCNFRCPLCSTFSNPEGKGILSLGDFKKIVDILSLNNFSGVVNISGGEPTLHPKLIKMVKYLSSRLPNIKIVVFTNGYWIGRPWWRHKLNKIIDINKVLIRFSLDQQHAEGAILAKERRVNIIKLKKIEAKRYKQAKAFFNACIEFGSKPGINFDFAFKGTMDEAAIYVKEKLGDVPIYLIKFQKNITKRTKQKGYFAIDIDSQGRPLVYITLGHIPGKNSLGGIEKIPTALSINRKFLSKSIDNIPKS